MGLTAGLPDHRGVDEGAGLDGFEGVDADVPLDDGFLADEAFVADDGAVLDPGGAHDVGVLADDAAAQVAVVADVHVVVDHGLVQEGAALDDDVRADDRVLADLHAGFDLGVVPDVERTAQHGVGVHVGAFGHPDSGRDLEAVDLDVDLALQHIGLGLHIALVGAHVLPVALGDIAVDGLSFLHELREDIPGPVHGGIGLDVVEDLGLHDVNARVHGVREDLAPGRLFQEAFDLALLVHDRDPEFQGIGNTGEANGDQAALLLVEGNEVREVEVGERVTGNDEEGVVLQRLFGVLHAAGGAERLLLVGIAQLHAELFAVPEVILDQGGEELDGHDRLIEPVPFQQPEHMLHDRPVGHRQERFGHARGHGTKTSAFAASHHDGLHVGNVLLEETTVEPTSPVRAASVSSAEGRRRCTAPHQRAQSATASALTRRRT